MSHNWEVLAVLAGAVVIFAGSIILSNLLQKRKERKAEKLERERHESLRQEIVEGLNDYGYKFKAEEAEIDLNAKTLRIDIGIYDFDQARDGRWRIYFDSDRGDHPIWNPEFFVRDRQKFQDDLEFYKPEWEKAEPSAVTALPAAS
ncbi:MAG: hypothetical protein ACREGG_01485 [Candidatus Saccharimonadales bacterium]